MPEETPVEETVASTPPPEFSEPTVAEPPLVGDETETLPEPSPPPADLEPVNPPASADTEALRAHESVTVDALFKRIRNDAGLCRRDGAYGGMDVLNRLIHDILNGTV